MPLYIRDRTVDELAERVRDATGARSKTEAVRAALEHELKRAEAARGFAARNARVMAMADALGPTDPAFDMTAFRDAIWERG